MYQRRSKGKQSAGQSSPCFCARFSVFFSIFIFLVVVSAGNAWSFENYNIHFLPGAAPSFEASSDSSFESDFSVADSCLLLLKSSVHSRLMHSALGENRRSAGSVAPVALGLVFGVRYALSPPKSNQASSNQARFDVWQSFSSAGDRSALAVADYRSCQKEKALKAIHNFHWSR